MVGFAGVTVGPVTALETVTARLALAVRFCASVTAAVSVCVPLGREVVFQLKLGFTPEAIVVPSALTVNVYPLPPLATTVTVVAPVTVAPLAGFVNDRVSWLGGGGGAVPAPLTT